MARRAVAVELGALPLPQARRNLALSGLAGRVLLVRGRGLACVRRAEVVVIAGVGGDLASELLAEVPRLGARRVIVQPNRHGREVRATARMAGYHLEAEQVIDEAGRLHLLLSFTRRDGPDPSYGHHHLDLELHLGPLLLASTAEPARRFLSMERRRLRTLVEHQPALAPALRLLDERG